jgi:Transposase DDE domain
MERAASELSQAIRTHFSLHPARLACLLGMIWGLIGSKRVQLWALAEQFGGDAQVASRVRRIERFLAKQALAWEGVARCIVAMVAIPGKWTLVMDRTNWQFGKLERNYLVLALVYEGNAIPLLVKDLEHAGNSDTSERITLMERFVVLFGKDKVHCLLADREFIGQDWFQWLKKNNIPPCIRTRNNTLVRHQNGGKVQVHTLLRSLPVGQYRTWDEKLYGQTLRMIGLKLADGGYLVLLADPALEIELLPLYKIRWSIECLFKNAKSSGFLWETTHLIHADRAEKLVAILALATTLAIKEGATAHALKPIPFRKTVQAPLYSLFTHGLRQLAAAFRTVQNPINLLISITFCESVG